MKLKINLSSVKFLIPLLAILLTLFLADSYIHSEAETQSEFTNTRSLFSPTEDHQKTSRLLVKKLKNAHYLKEPLDDSFSEKIYNNYLEMLDPSRVHFLKKDIEEFSSHIHSFDDDLKKGNLNPAFYIFNRYHERRRERLNFTLGLLDRGIESFDFAKEESLELDRKKLPWPDDMNEAKDLWRRLLKNDILILKLDETKDDEILKTVTKRFRNQLQLLEQTNDDDVFESFILAYTRSYDPHTEYFAPEESENFDINMRLSLEGIGALLQSDDMYVKVVRLIPGGPAEKGNELQPEDLIVAVAQGEDSEFTDVEGWRIDDVVKLIRGPSGTIVRLKVIPEGSVVMNTRKIISITREAVKLEEQSAKKDVIEIKRGETPYRIGVIRLPAFYVDFEAAMSNDPDYRSSSRDVEKHLLELTNENIDGLIFDLRNNGGGSLQEVNEMTGLFIKTGPVVQIRDSRNQITRLGDLDPKLIYSGPLAVVVNRLSASASEIFAGAVQDYGRGIIVGSQTFGKGTVQSMEGLNSGRVKYTEAKYYRINGDSTQNRGVIPDIIFPSFLDHDEIGESSLPQTMAWDQIQSADYFRIASLDSIVDSLITEHKKRIAEDPDFKYLSERADLLKENRKKSTISLNEIERREERESMKERLLDMENRRRQALGLELYKDYAEMESAEKEKEKEEETDFQQDSMLRETGEILTDWLFELRPEK